MRQDGSVKIRFADPERDAATQNVSCNRAGERQQRGFRGEQEIDCPVGSAQGFHHGKIFAALKHGTGKRGDHAKHDQYHDHGGGREHDGAGLADDGGLGLRDLADWLYFDT